MDASEISACTRCVGFFLDSLTGIGLSDLQFNSGSERLNRVVIYTGYLSLVCNCPLGENGSISRYSLPHRESNPSCAGESNPSCAV